MNQKGSGAMVAFTVFCLAAVIALFAQSDLSIGQGKKAHLEHMDPSSSAPDRIHNHAAGDMVGGTRRLNRNQDSGQEAVGPRRLKLKD